jgi:signal transduction histidine kinase/ActR/RegA family two-component response regulator
MNAATSLALPKRIARTAACVTFLLGATALAGWALDLKIFKSVFPGFTPMVPNAATGFVLGGFSLWLLITEPVPPLRKRLAQLCALIVAVAGALTLAETLFGWQLPLDQVLFPKAIHALGGMVPGRPAILVAIAFLSFAMALLLLDARLPDGSWLLDLIILIPVFAALLALIGYACNVPPFYGWRSLYPNTVMAFPTAVALTLLGTGLLCARQNRGLMQILTSSTTGGDVARWLLLAPVIIPLVTGLINAELESRVVARTMELENTANDLANEIVQRKRAQEKTAWLASFPEQNPNPVVEFDLGKGVVEYANASARDLFPELQSQGTRHPWLAGLQEIATGLLEKNAAQVSRREVFVGETCHAQTINPVPETGRVRVYSSEITERRRAEERVLANLARLELLHQITRAIAERQDLRSIFQIVIRRLEERLPIDFGCVCLYDGGGERLTVASIGNKSQPLGSALGLIEGMTVQIDENGLSNCVRGRFVYEPDASQLNFPFPRKLAEGGLRSLVIAPLLVESNVFGVLVAARREAQSFSSGDCEFLRQLSEHAALAANQAQLYSALQRAYDDLRQSQQAMMQQERLRALGEMASGIAHDINNALSPVALYAESLLEKEKNLSPQAREQLQIIERAVGDVAATVARMREFYRKREPQLTLAPVDLNQLVSQVLELTRARWGDMSQRGGLVIESVTELAPDLPNILGAESEIRDALTNIVFNAVDAMPTGGTLSIRTRSPQTSAGFSQMVQVEVADTGIGMDEETRKRCLEPFFTTKGERGTGLGLAMVYGAVQRHGGDIDIESAPNRGTTVGLSFPALTGTPATRRETAFQAPLARQRVLIVDDDLVLLKSLRDILEADGHFVAAANSGQEGLHFFAEARRMHQPFDIVITDLGMPQVDGRKVAAAVKGVSPATPVILLTGWGQRLIAEGDIPPHVDLVLSKPPKVRELRRAFVQCASVPSSAQINA